MARPKKWTDEKIEQEAEYLAKWFNDPTKFWLKDFAIERGYCSQYLSEFAEKSEAFNESLKRAKEIQESRLVKMGLSKKYNGAMAIFALKNVAGWRDSFPNDGESNHEALKRIADFIEGVRKKEK